MDETKRQRLQTNWQQVNDEVQRAIDRAGRDPASVKIVGVSKYVDAELTQALVDVGCHDLGESRPQSLWEKSASVSHPDIRWHLIGHLQRNKIRRTLPSVSLIHSVDSPRLLDALAKEAESQHRVVDALLELNISGDASKTGLLPDQLSPLLAALPITGVRIRGLMAMSGWGTDPGGARQQFAAARCYRDQLQEKFGQPLPELSMGMSGDFAAAIAEGATIVRIGSRLFEGVT
jgi:pyridoxal phosphate enzyme (YggS family)